MTKSASFALSVSRKNPRRCARQLYCTPAPSCFAIKSAIRFSKPSSRSFENGRLFGSAAIRRTSLFVSTANTFAQSNSAKIVLKREDIQGSSLGRFLFQVGQRVCESRDRCRIFRIKICGHQRAGPSTDPGQNRDILFSV